MHLSIYTSSVCPCVCPLPHPSGDASQPVCMSAWAHTCVWGGVLYVGQACIIWVRGTTPGREQGWERQWAPFSREQGREGPGWASREEGTSGTHLLQVAQEGLLVVHLVRAHGPRPVKDCVQGFLIEHLHLWAGSRACPESQPAHPCPPEPWPLGVQAPCSPPPHPGIPAPRSSAHRQRRVPASI